jgi:hypothetical protein
MLLVGAQGDVLEVGHFATGSDPARLWSEKRIRDAYFGGAQSKAPT